MFRIRTVCKLLGFCSMLGGGASFSLAQGVDRVASEDDYFANVPVVLTASRLEQPLNEAPGAMTVIDRKTIKLSGARNVVEVLRLVPGYLVGGWNGANPVASYHVPLDDYGTRNLVLIDGRSVYSSTYRGDTHRGLMDVMLEDIERIEILRGANSAAYGANAMFGVINIITRHSADTIGGEVLLTSGNDGILGQRARIGVGDETASFRLSVGEQRDSGYLHAYDDARLRQVHGRADWKPSLRDDVMVSIGVTSHDAGEGSAPDDVGNPFHTITTQDSYFQAAWHHQVREGGEIRLSMSYMEDTRKDLGISPNDEPDVPGTAVYWDYSGKGRRTNWELEYISVWRPDLRTLVGVGYKSEATQSMALYASPNWVGYDETRVFGTVEWRIAPQWLLNGGLFVGHHSEVGNHSSPRMMVNWLASDNHTFRAGVTESTRTPSLYELRGNTRIYTNVGALYDQEVLASGQVKPETLQSREIGYLGRFPSANMTLDVRLYEEAMRGVIRSSGVDFKNRTDLSITGSEFQLKWHPVEGSEIWVNQSFTNVNWQVDKFERSKDRFPPRYATTIAWFQKLPSQLQLSVLYQYSGAWTWRDFKDWQPAGHRTDIRLAYPFRVGPHKAEAAVTVQSLEGAKLVLPREGFEQGRRTFMNISMEY
ncbi:TonB-dependent receptor plug domain-containing protein [Aquabacterium sp.]|uniref:TonB-dependent receptor plug domain-containing protein n=1 Tax=Aquabacterium sp. TaxID=1872578 RepID=UPI003B714A7C